MRLLGNTKKDYRDVEFEVNATQLLLSDAAVARETSPSFIDIIDMPFTDSFFTDLHHFAQCAGLTIGQDANGNLITSDGAIV